MRRNEETRLRDREMADFFVVLVTLDGRGQFNRVLDGEGEAKASAERYAKDILTLQGKGDQGCWEVFTSKVIDRQSFAYGGTNVMLDAPQGGRMLVGSDSSIVRTGLKKVTARPEERIRQRNRGQSRGVLQTVTGSIFSVQKSNLGMAAHEQ